MALTITLEDNEAEILAFVLDSTLEEWKEQKDGQLDNFIYDPGITSVEQLMEATGFLVQMNETIRTVRAKLAMVPS